MRTTSNLLAAAGLCAFLASTPAGAMGPTNDSPAASDYSKGVAAVESKDYAGAVKLLTGVIQQEPNNADAFTYLAFSLRMQGKPEDSVRYYQRALAIKPDHARAAEYLGEAYLTLKDLPKAEAQLAAIERICGTGCKEYAALSGAIATYKRDPAAPRQKSG